MTLEMRDGRGCTPLFVAVRHRNEAMVEFLLDNHANPDFQGQVWSDAAV